MFENSILNSILPLTTTYHVGFSHIPGIISCISPVLIRLQFQHLLTRDSDWGNPTESRHHTPHNTAQNGEIRETMQLSPAVQQRGAGGAAQAHADTTSENNTRFVVLFSFQCFWTIEIRFCKIWRLLKFESFHQRGNVFYFRE